MAKLIDLTGQKFGRLTIVKRGNNIGKIAAWLCKCDCGNICIIRGISLRNKDTKSCGCLLTDKLEICDRFWPKVVLKARKDLCWEWTGALKSKSDPKNMYGIFNIDGKTQKAHRVSWQLTNGNIPNGIQVCHKCDNPICVNPNHLFLGTQKDNTQDCINKNRKTDPPIRYGEKNNKSKLKEDQVLKIREMYSTKLYTFTDLSKIFNTASNNISLIINRKTWKNI